MSPETIQEIDRMATDQAAYAALYAAGLLRNVNMDAILSDNGIICLRAALRDMQAALEAHHKNVSFQKRKKSS